MRDVDLAYLQLIKFKKQTEELDLRSFVEKCAWISERADRYRELFKIFACAIALPLANAEVERGFSLMNNVTTKKRNKLKNDLLLALMLLAKYDDFQFDFDALGVELSMKWYDLD